MRHINEKPLIIGIIIMILSSVLFFSGCTEPVENTQKNPENESIIGTWTVQEDSEESTYMVLYSFYSNSSFFTGVFNLTSLQYDTSLWGTYSLTETRITLEVTEYDSTSNLKYSLSEDNNTLLLYYQDEATFDVLIRES